MKNFNFIVGLLSSILVSHAASADLLSFDDFSEGNLSEDSLKLETHCDKQYDKDGPLYSKNFAPAVPANPLQTPLRVVSYNVKIAQRINQAIGDLVQLQGDHPIDFLLVQEIISPVGGQQPGAVEQVARALKMNYVFAPAIVRDGVDYGNAIFSRWPIGRFSKILLPLSKPGSCNRRIAVHASALVNGTGIDVFTLHLSTYFSDSYKGEEERVGQLAPLLQALTQIPQRVPVFVGGDFNSFNPLGLQKVEAGFASIGFLNAHDNKGWTFKHPHFALDHIFSRGFSVLGSGNDFTAVGSDHIPIWSVLQIANQVKSKGD